MVWPERNGLVVAGERRFRLPGVFAGHAEIAVRSRIGGVERDRLADQMHGIGWVAHLECNDTQVMQRLSVVRLQLQNFAVQRLRTADLSAHVQFQRLVKPGFCPWIIADWRGGHQWGACVCFSVFGRWLWATRDRLFFPGLEKCCEGVLRFARGQPL